MTNDTPSFSYEKNFDYFGERWAEIHLDESKGYFSPYDGVERLPKALRAFPLDLETYGVIHGYLIRADRLISLAQRVTQEEGFSRKIDIVHSFLIRGTRAFEAFAELLGNGDVGNAWAMARVLIERYIWLGYILKKEKIQEFYEYSALEMKRWASKAASLEIIDPDSVEDWDWEMEEELGHKLGRTEIQWDNPNVESMCNEAFGKPSGVRIYSLYRLASMSTHPGMDDCGEYFISAQVPTPSGRRTDSGPLEEILKLGTEVFAGLITLSEAPITEQASMKVKEEGIRLFLDLKVKSSSIDERLLNAFRVD